MNQDDRLSTYTSPGARSSPRRFRGLCCIGPKVSLDFYIEPPAPWGKVNCCIAMFVRCKGTHIYIYIIYITHSIPCVVYFTHTYHRKQPYVGKYTKHGWYGLNKTQTLKTTFHQLQEISVNYAQAYSVYRAHRAQIEYNSVSI